MEYTIYSESLVYYALQDDTGMYLTTSSIVNGVTTLTVGYLNKDTYLCNSINEAKELQKKFPEFKHIKRLKLICIGEEQL